MRAIVYDRFGPAGDVLHLLEVPTPKPAAGEVLVRLKASGVNPTDVKLRAGGRPGINRPPYPRIIPHNDGAGTIEAVGPGVPTWRVGERVWVWNGQWQRAFGTAAEYNALTADQAVALPDGVSCPEGAALGIPGVTAVHAVLGGGDVAGKWLLVSGAGGAVGNLAVQCATAGGARVLATARGTEGLQAARQAGAAHVFDYSSATLAEEILEATGGALVDRIVEVEFGQNAETNAKIIAERGTIAAYGSAKDMTPTLPFYPLMFKAVTIDLILVYLLSSSERAAAVGNLTGLLRQGALDLRVSRVLDLEQCARAHDLIAAGDRAGPVILEI